MTYTGKAMVFHGSGNSLQPREFEFPKLKEGELLVKISYCAICTSDLHTISGKRDTPLPMIPGHEIVGVISQLPNKGSLKDSRGQTLHTGDFITWTLNASCGKCDYCRREMPQKCKSLIKYGHSAITEKFCLNGGMADHIHLREGTAIIKLDRSVPEHIYTSINCSLSTVMAAIHAAGNVNGTTALIFGAGMLGTLSSAVLKTQKASKIIAIDPNQNRLEIIQRFGASHTIQWPGNLSEDGLTQAINTITLNQGADLVFDMSGSNNALKMAPKIMATGSKLILGGSVFPSPDISFNPETIVRKLWQIKGVHNYNTRDFLAAERFLAINYNTFPFEELFCPDFYPLAETDAAIKSALTKQFHRVIIKP